MNTDSEYLVYGQLLRSDWPLPLPRTRSSSDAAAIDLLRSEVSLLHGVRDGIDAALVDSDWFIRVSLADGSDYLRWRGLFEFIVSRDGRRIVGHALPEGSLERLQTYLLGQVVSCALVRQGVEQLHSTTVAIDGSAIAFIGDTGYGKSTLASAFLRAGHTLVTDDLLVLRAARGRWLACPGPPRIKLYPHVAALTLGIVGGVTMNPGTPKAIMPLAANQTEQSDVPLEVVYVLSPPDEAMPDSAVKIAPLTPREATIALTANTFNTVIQGPERTRQQFEYATTLAASLPVKRLTVPRDLGRLHHAVDAVLNDLG